MTGATELVEKALKQAFDGCDCFGGVLPMWEFDGNFKQFLAEKSECKVLKWTVEFESQQQKDDGCDVVVTGSYRIRIYSDDGAGRKASRDAADCLICCLSAAGAVRVTADDDAEQGLKLHFSNNKQKPFVRRRGKDGHGRAVTEIGVPYTAVTCKC